MPSLSARFAAPFFQAHTAFIAFWSLAITPQLKLYALVEALVNQRRDILFAGDVRTCERSWGLLAEHVNARWEDPFGGGSDQLY